MLVGAVHLTVAAALPAVAVTPVGAPGSDETTPLPVSGTLTVLPFESVTLSWAFFGPVVVGAKTTPISHPPPLATGVVHPFVGGLECVELAPVIVAEAMLIGPVPVFPMTTLLGAEEALTAW